MLHRRRAAARARPIVYALVVMTALLVFIAATRMHQHRRRSSESQPLADTSDDSPTLVAIADLHGDLRQAVRALQLAQLVDSSGVWVGGIATLVQLGDLLDRGPDSLAVVRLFERLREEAEASGGRVVTLLGNHELLNLQGQHQYVSATELQALAAESGKPADEGLKLWREAMSQGSPMGAALRQRPVLALEGAGACRTLFVHAGVLPGLLTAEELRHPGQQLEPEQLVAALNARVQRALHCSGGVCAVENAAKALLDGPDSLVWSRQYVRLPERRVCDSLAAVLERLDAGQLVAGHSVMWQGPQERCGGRLFMMDVGISSAVAGRLAAWRCSNGRTEVLQPG